MDQSTLERDGRLERLRAELEEQAQVFEDPGAYLAGVDDVFQAVSRRANDELPPPGGWFG